MSVIHDYEVIAAASVLHLPVTDPAVAAAFHDLPQALERERLSDEGRLG